MKILYYTDPHITGRAFRSRMDNYFETIMAKMSEIRDLSHEYKVDFNICGGDLFDSFDTAPSIVSKAIGVIKNFYNETYIVSGSHDVYGSNYENIPRTMFGLMASADVLTPLFPGERKLIKKGDISLQLTGQPAHYDLEKSLSKEGYIVTKPYSVDYAIHVVHGFLVKEKFMDNVAHTLISDITNTQADITLSGHIHGGFGVVEIDGKYFCNPGAVGRTDASLDELKRAPKVVLIHLGDNGIDLELIPLKSAKPGPEVLSREGIEEMALRKAKLKGYEAKLEGFEASVGSVDNIYEDIDRMKGVSELTKSIVRDEISSAELKWREMQSINAG